MVPPPPRPAQTESSPPCSTAYSGATHPHAARQSPGVDAAAAAAAAAAVVSPFPVAAAMRAAVPAAAPAGGRLSVGWGATAAATVPAAATVYPLGQWRVGASAVAAPVRPVAS